MATTNVETGGTGYTTEVLAAARAIVLGAVIRGPQLLEKGGSEVGLASIFQTLSIDPTFMAELSASSTGRVTANMGRLSTTSLREDVLGSGSIQTSTLTDKSIAVPAGLICIEPDLPEHIEVALEAVGVEMDVARSMYTDETYGPVFRQRIKSKFRCFVDLVTRGLIANPTGFFVSAVRKNWRLSSTYEPGKVKPMARPVAEVEREASKAREEADRRAAQERVDLVATVSPEEQWTQARATLKLLLSGALSAEAWARLEERARSGLVSAAALAQEALRAKTAGTLPLLVATLS